MKEDNKVGLSNSNRCFIVGIVFATLLIFGPIEPYGLFIRIAYLVAIPMLAWIVFGCLGKRWNLNNLSNDRLNRALLAFIAGTILIFSIMSPTPKEGLSIAKIILGAIIAYFPFTAAVVDHKKQN
jgi:hypothetical protein